MNNIAQERPNIHDEYYLSPFRKLTDVEKTLIWEKPKSHRTSEEEKRICKEVKRNWEQKEMKIANILLEGDAGSGKTQLAKALSADFGLPYTKVTCFADMDKSDIIGAILPVISDKQLKKMNGIDRTAYKALYDSDGFESATKVLVDIMGITAQEANEKIKQLIKLAEETVTGNEVVQYRFYPSEIVRAYKNGYILEIQEPTVIRDAAVLMALNSALELDGSINLPTETIHRHPDFMAVITTNRNYLGCKPLNESLRDRVHHTEKMDLPTKEVMIERAIAKTGFNNFEILQVLAEVIIILDKTARANAIKGVAGMRSYFYWVDAVAHDASIAESLYNKVIYKITTDADEIRLLEEALKNHGLLKELEAKENDLKKPIDAVEIKSQGNSAVNENNKEGIVLKKSESSDKSKSKDNIENNNINYNEHGNDDGLKYHQANQKSIHEQEEDKEREFRKQLNKSARIVVSDTIHKGVRLIVHRPEYNEENQKEYISLRNELQPIVEEAARKAFPLLEKEVSTDLGKHHVYGNHFNADNIVYNDFRYFSKRLPPNEAPSLVVGIRVDESASMSAGNRIEAAKRAVTAVYEFCRICNVPVLIYGDTADISKLEQMSIYAYIDFEKYDDSDGFRLMDIKGRSNNRDGMALRIVAERLLTSVKQTKLLISISDGQPKAMEDYTGSLAIDDMKQTIAEYERKGITFLSAAIGQDKDIISQIYGDERFLDITNLSEFPTQLVHIISRYL